MIDGSRLLARSTILPEGKNESWPTITEHEDLKLDHLQTRDDLMEMEDLVLDLEQQVDEAEKSENRWRRKYNDLKRDYKSQVAEGVREGSQKLYDQLNAYQDLISIATGVLVKVPVLHQTYVCHPDYKRLMKTGGLI